MFYVLYIFLLNLWLSSSDVCEYSSDEEEFAPVQYVVSKELELKDVLSPTVYTSREEFEGVIGSLAVHEGVDYINDNELIADVPVFAVDEGRIVYVRTGCPEEKPFKRNNLLRECGAGWGNHIVVEHKGYYSRLAHLRLDSMDIKVNDLVKKGDILAYMGNSGRSDERHLHFELGLKSSGFISCSSSQSFDGILNPSLFGY